MQIPSDVLRRFLQEDGCDVRKVQILLNKGLEANQEIGDYDTMLHHAAIWGKLEPANLLLESGHANLDIVNKKHGTLLQIAAYIRKGAAQDIVKFLLNRGANAIISSGHYGALL